jgi:hypothetical protein
MRLESFGVLMVLVHTALGDKVALQRRQADHLNAVAAAEAAAAAHRESVQAALEAAEAAAQAAEAAREKRARDKDAFNSRLEKSRKDALRHGDFSVHQTSPEFHHTTLFRVKPNSADDFCVTVPRANNFVGLRNGNIVM